MNRLTNEQRLQIIEFYYQNGCCGNLVHRALLPFYGQFNRPTETAFLWVYVKAHVYTNKPASIDALGDNIETFIPDEMFGKVQL